MRKDVILLFSDQIRICDEDSIQKKDKEKLKENLDNPIASLLYLVRTLESNIEYNHREFRELEDDVRNLRSQVSDRVVELERRVRELERRGR